MIWQFWRNPEFVRHCRSELRKGRAIVVATVVALVAILTILVCWSSQRAKIDQMRRSETFYRNSRSMETNEEVRAAVAAEVERQDKLIQDSEGEILTHTTRNAYGALLWMQFIVLTFWSLLSGAQAISRERERGTWDFQRTTRLTSSELILGKLLGEPVLAYFIFFFWLPVSVALGLMGGVKLANVLSANFLIVIAAIFIGIAGLWLSSLFESKSRGIGLIGALAMYGVFLGLFGLADSPFTGLGGFSPLTLLLPLSGHPPNSPLAQPTIFGEQLPWLLMTILLYLSFGAWIVLMLLRSVKKDLADVSLLSNWQAIGCCAFLNFVIYATFNPSRASNAFADGSDFVTFLVTVNAMIFFFLGLALLRTSERLQTTASSPPTAFLSEDGLQWPWLLISGVVSYLLLVWGLFAWKLEFGFDTHILALSAIRFAVALAFATSSVLFIQWCKLTRLRAPLLKGMLFLSLYYATCGVIFGVVTVFSQGAATSVANALTPAAALEPDKYLFSTGTLLGIVIQLMAIAFLISAIRSRVRQPELIAVAVQSI